VAAQLAMAEEALAAAQTLLDRGLLRSATSRAYYAMFHTASALLASRGLGFSKHTAVHAAYGREFAHSQDLDPKFHRWLLSAFSERLDSDYAVGSLQTSADVAEVVRQAEEFATAARAWLHTSAGVQ
jgi:uncharacterized protein (UPF0332 family)